jgi:hypothetical protein
VATVAPERAARPWSGQSVSAAIGRVDGRQRIRAINKRLPGSK